MQSKMEKDHAFKKRLAGRSCRIGGVALFAVKHWGGLHDLAIICTLGEIRPYFLSLISHGNATMAASGDFASLAANVFDLFVAGKGLG
jgi:hypothetical protein